MASFTPPLGSSSPEVLADNASRLDKLLNSTELTVPDRSGEALKSWFAIQDGFDKIVSSLDSAGTITRPDIASGLAATTNGQYFRVPQGTTSNNAFIYYRNVSGVATVVAITRGAEIYGTKLTPTTDLKTLAPGPYYLTAPDVSSLVSSGNAVALGYPSGLVPEGSMVLDVVGRSGDSYSYQFMSLPTQAISFVRGVFNNDPLEWSQDTGAVEITATTNLNSLKHGSHFVRQSVLAAVIAAGTATALGYPPNILSSGSAQIIVTARSYYGVSQRLFILPSDGVFYTQERLANSTFTAWVNPSKLTYQRAIGYANQNFARITDDETDYFPYADMVTPPNFISNASHWAYNSDRSTITLTAPTATAAYVGWQYPSTPPGKVKFAGSGYTLVSGTAFIIRVRFLATNTTANSGADVLKTVDMPLTLADGKYSFELDDVVVPAATKYVRMSVTIASASAPGQVTFNAGLFMHILSAVTNTVSGIVEEQIEATVPPMIVTEVEKQIGLASDGLTAYVERGDVLLSDNGTIKDRLANHSFISWWGSSTLYRMSSKLTEMAVSLGITGNQVWGAFAGEVYQQTAARMGAIPAQVVIPSGVIPASGAVPVNITNFIAEQRSAFGGVTGTLNGIVGTLAYNASSPTLYLFTRSAAGSAIAVSPTAVFELTPTYNRNNISGYGILNIGKNNLALEIATAREVFDVNVAMHQFYRPFFKRILDLNHYPNTAASANGIDLIHDYNALTAKRYGSLSIDNAAYLLSSQIWTDAAITPTSADLAAQSKGVIAPSLSSDGMHMNSPIEQLVIDKLMKPKMQELWFS